MFAVIGKKIVTKLQATSAFTTANGSNKVFPVIIPQGVSYPCSTFEITNVSNFLSKGASLNSCDVSIDLDDDYFKTPEKFYKNVNFNCLIIKN